MIRALAAGFRALTRLWPGPFREQYGEAAVDTFVQRLSAARRRGPVRAWGCVVRELATAVWLAVRWRLPDRPLDRSPVTARGVDAGTSHSPAARRQRAWSLPGPAPREGAPAPGGPRSFPRRAPPGAPMESIAHDLRAAARTLRRSPGLTVTVVLTLALGIGANTLTFSVVDTILLGALPYPDADRIVHVGGVQEALGDTLPQSAADFADFRETSTVFSAMTLYTTNARFTLAGDGPPVEVQGLAVSDGFFDVFGIEPLAGRAFGPEEDVPGNDNVVILSRGLWQRRFGADPGVVGQELLLTGAPHTIVGIAGAGLDERDIDLLVPLALTASQWANRRSHFLQAYGRLLPEVTLDEAQTEMSAIAARLEAAYPETNTGQRVNLTPIRERLVGPVGRALVLLQGAVAFVLLIACANVAGLLVVRTADRSREMAIRSALGAGRLRVARQLLTESLLLAVLGGAAGTLLATWGLRSVNRLIPPDMSLAVFGSIDVDLRVLAFTGAVSLLTGLVFGLLPALRLARGGPGSALRSGATRGATGRSCTSAGLVVAQVALALVLLVGAGLLVRSFDRVLDQDLGFDTGNVLTLQITRPSSSDPDRDLRRARFWTELAGAVAGLPDVESAGVAQVLPFSSNWTNSFTIEGGEVWAEGRGPEVEWRSVSPGLLETLRVPLLAGRMLSDRDGPDAPPVALVDATLATRFFADGEAVGRRIKINPYSTDNPWLEIVGVVGAVRQAGAGSEPRITVYQPVAQQPERTMMLAARTRTEPLLALPSIEARVRELDPQQPVAAVTTLDAALQESVWVWRFASTVLGLFAGIALLLAAAGIHGVLAWSVARRTREIGVRISLGASRGDVLRLVVGRGMLLVATGAALGLLAAAALSRLLGSLLFGIGPFDPATYLTILATLAIVAVAATWLPARRASRVDPVTALAGE